MHSFLYFTLFFFLFPATIYSQDFPSEKQVDTFITALQQQGVDTICTFKYDDVGFSRLTNAEEYCEGKEDDVYIFWKQKGITYLTKKDNCRNASPVMIKKDDFWNFYFKNQTIIENEKIECPGYIVKDETGKHNHPIMRNHYGFDRIIFYNNGRAKPLKDIPYYYFLKKIQIDGKKYKNINYKNTKSSYTNQLRNLLKLIIRKNYKKFEASK